MPAHLNDGQREAIETTDGAVLVLAGPGTGKTRVISERFAYLVESGKARPDEILTLTFSRKAAGEMEDRIVRRLRRSFSRLPISTFHSFCLRIVMRYYDQLGYDEPPGLVTAQEQRRRIADLLARQDPARWDMFRSMLHSQTLVQGVLDFVLRAEEYLRSPDAIAELASVNGRRDWAEIAPFMALYQEDLCRENLIDYGLIIQRAVELLDRDPQIRERVRRAYRFVMVDEYQDTNPGQDRLLQLLVEGHGNLFVVGDPAQSIYAFRGTAARNIEDFGPRFNARVVSLSESYRSPQALIDLAQRVISVNGDTRRLVSERSATARVVACKHTTGTDEMDWVAREIQRLHAYEGVAFGDIAVLLRTVKGVASRVEDALRRAGVPAVIGGGSSILDVPVVRDILRLLRIASGDHGAEILMAALSSPLFGLDPLLLRSIQRDATLREVSLRDALRAIEDPAAIEPVGCFMTLVDELRVLTDGAEAGNNVLPSLVYHIWDGLPYFRALLGRGDEVSVLTTGAVTAYYDSVVRFAERNGDVTLAGYLEMIERADYVDDSGYTAGAVTSDAVHVGSVHRAKGLEFEAVFLPHLVEGSFPSAVRSHPLVDLSVLAGGASRSPETQSAEHLAEERRVFYVGVTRAERCLYLSYAEGDGQPSRFIGEALGMPEIVLDPAPRDERFLSAAQATAVFRRRYNDPASPQIDRLVALYGLAVMPDLDPSSWWCHVTPTENDRALFDGPLRTSFSKLGSYEQCPSRYRYSVVDQLGDSGSVATIYGSLIHQTLDAIFARPLRHLDEALAYLDEIWDDTAFRFLPVSREKKRDAQSILERLYGYLANDEWPTVLALEKKFSFPFQGHTVRGVIDRIDRVGDRGLRLLDYKTGTVKSKDEAKSDLQLALYYLACLLESDLRQLGTPQTLEYVFLKDPQKKSFATRPQPITPDHREATEERLRVIFDAILAEQFEPKKGAWCRYCAFKTLCPLVPEGQMLGLTR